MTVSPGGKRLKGGRVVGVAIATSKGKPAARPNVVRAVAYSQSRGRKQSIIFTHRDIHTNKTIRKRRRRENLVVKRHL